MKWFSFVAAIAAATLLVGCGGSDPEVDLERASKAAEATRSEVEIAAEKVKQREADVKQAQTKLAEARNALRAIEAELAKREAQVDSSATDEVLFRAVQKRLLDDGDLANVAIAAHVNNGLVTLSGNVPDAKIRDRAILVARETPGVQRIETHIQVVSAKAKSKAKAKPEPSAKAPKK
jgi:osmotically-inducible protein OsmY